MATATIKTLLLNERVTKDVKTTGENLTLVGTVQIFEGKVNALNGNIKTTISSKETYVGSFNENGVNVNSKEYISFLPEASMLLLKTIDNINTNNIATE